nr:flavodoxin family protein [uncultured Agathobaculum sp.]
MSKKVLIVASSPRRNGNSNNLAEAFAKGAAQAGNQVETVYLCEKNIGVCRGCLSCQTTQRCVIQDDADAIVQKMGAADVLAFATPIYYYGMSGQMKTMLDRANPLFPSDYAFRDVYLLTAAAEDDPETPEGAVHGLQGWISCFEKASLAGNVFAGGVTDAGDIEGHPALQTAFEMGSRI